MSTPSEDCRMWQHADASGTTLLTQSTDERTQQICAILKSLYYATPGEFDTAETRSLARRLVLLSKLREVREEEARIKYADAFCTSDLPSVFQRIWSVSDHHQRESLENAAEAIKRDSRPAMLEDDERPFSSVYKDVVTCLWNITDLSIGMCKLILERGCLEIFVGDLKLPLFLSGRMNEGLTSTTGYITRAYFGIMRNAVRFDLGCQSRFIQLHGVDVTVPYLDTSFQYLKMKVIMLLADVITDEHDEARPSIVCSRTNLHYIAKVLADACTGTQYDGFYSRKYGYGAAELLDTIAKLATSNDRNVQMFLETDLFDSLEQLLTRLHSVFLDCCTNRSVGTALDSSCKSTCCELLKASFTCLWAFAFNDSAKETLLQRHAMLLVVRACTAQAQQAGIAHLLNAAVHRKAAGALWQLQRCSSVRCMLDGRTHEHSPVRATSDTHLMITYQHSSTDSARALHDALTALGLRVWIDYADMCGSTVEAMALAVERASALLVCVSNAYKQSPSCRAEAVYAYRLKKRFVPVRVQFAYVPDGWLSLVCGNEPLVDLLESGQCDAAMRHLVHLLRQRGLFQTDPSSMSRDRAAFTTANHAASVAQVSVPKRRSQIDHVFVPPEASHDASLNGSNNYSTMTSTSSSDTSTNTGAESFCDLTSIKDLTLTDTQDDKVCKFDSGDCLKSTSNASQRNAAYCSAESTCLDSDLASWNNQDVSNWLLSQRVDQLARDRLHELDGSLLLELAAMQKEAPQFLYSALRADYHLPLLSVLRILRALHAINSTRN